jgi:hypothetical protein
MNSSLPTLVVTSLVFLTSSLSTTFADGLENGDFSKGKSHWMGDGTAVTVNADGSVGVSAESKAPSSLALPPIASPGTEPKPGSPSVIEIKLKSTQFADFFQKFKTPKEIDGMGVEVVYKGSADFKPNDKATVYDRDIDWKPGGIWYWTALVNPKVDMIIRMDKRDIHDYRLQAVKPGGAWQTAKFRWTDVGGNQDVTFHILATPGHGALYIKSVTLTP